MLWFALNKTEERIEKKQEAAASVHWFLALAYHTALGWILQASELQTQLIQNCTALKERDMFLHARTLWSLSKIWISLL